MLWTNEYFPRVRRPSKLPVILSGEELMQFFDHVAQSEIPRGVDGLLRRRTTRLRGGGAENIRYRLPAQVDPGRARQGEKGPLRHAVARVLEVLRRYWYATCPSIGYSPPGGLSGIYARDPYRPPAAKRRYDPVCVRGSPLIC